MKRRNRATRRRKMRGGANETTGAAATQLKEMEQLKQTHENDLTGQRGQIETKVKKYNAMKRDELRPRDSSKFPDLVNLYKDLNSKVDSILQNLDLVDKNRVAVLQSIDNITTVEKLQEYLEKDKQTQDEAFSTLFATIDSEETEINEMKTKLDSKVSAEQKAREERLNSQKGDDVLGEDVEEENSQPDNSPSLPQKVESNNKGVPILDEIKDENVSQAIENTLPYFEAEKNRLESGQSSVNQKPKSPEKTVYLEHINKEKKIIEGKIADLENKSKVQDIKALIAEEKEARQARLETEQELLDKMSDSLNPFSKGNLNTGESFNDAIREGTELQMMKKENNLSTGLTEEKKQLEGIKKELTSSEQATQEKKPQGPSQEKPDPLADAGDTFTAKPGTDRPVTDFDFPVQTSEMGTGTEPSSGVTVDNVKMVCTNLIKKIADLEEQIAKLQESNTGTPTKLQKSKTITPTKLPKDNKGTSKGGRKSRNNKKKKKSKAKKNKTRRRRRSKA